MEDKTVQQAFNEALDALIEQIKHDRSVLAALLCGSLSYDTVWSKSDIDLILITVDDRKIESTSRALYSQGINVHAFLIPRADFRKTVEGQLQNSFFHSLLAKGRLLYTHDESIERLCSRLHSIGERDTELQMLNAATHALPAIYKARKFLITRGDLEYTAMWILFAASSIAKLEIVSRRMLADREVIPQAMKLNPELFRIIYSDLLNAKKTRKSVTLALETIEKYIATRASTLFALLLKHLREVGEVRSCTEIETYFERNYGIEGVTTACEYLADQGLIGKASTTVQLTKKSNVGVQELAFFYLEEPPDEW